MCLTSIVVYLTTNLLNEVYVMIILGMRDVDYVNKNNERVVGKQLYFADDLKNGEGYRPLMRKNYDGGYQADFFIREQYIADVFPDGIRCGVEVDVSFDQYGRLARCTFIR